MDIKRMTAETLAEHKKAGVPAECRRCEAPIAEGALYTGGGLNLKCVPCERIEVRQRIRSYEGMLARERANLDEIDAALAEAV